MYLLYDMYLIAGKQLSLEPHGMGDGVSFLPFIKHYMKRKNRNTSHLLYAVVFSYVCILNFVFQYDCMRKTCILKIKWGNINLCFHQS